MTGRVNVNLCGWRKWRNVQRDLQAAAKKRDQARRTAERAFAATGIIDQHLLQLLEQAEQTYWLHDREARRFRNFTRPRTVQA